MSGNSIAASVSGVQGDWSMALHRTVPIPAFVFGVVAGAVLCETLARRGVRAILAGALTLESLFLLVFVVSAGDYSPRSQMPFRPAWAFYIRAALPAIAMGIQNAALGRVAAVRVRTTFITGMLTNAAEEAVVSAYWFVDQVRRRRLPRLLRLLSRRDSVQHMALYFGIWLAYVGGAAAGAWCDNKFGLLVLLAPVGALIAIAIRDYAAPITRPPMVTPKAEWQP